MEQTDTRGALSSGTREGSRGFRVKLHSVVEGGNAFRDIAGAIGKGLGSEVGPQTAEKFGFLSFAVNKDNPTSSKITKKKFGWTPVEIGLLDDIEADYCNNA